MGSPQSSGLLVMLGRWLWSSTFGVALALLFTGSIVRADPLARHAEPWLTGDWSGYRTDLFNKGVDVQLVYVSELAYNIGGGVRQLVDYTDQVAFGTTLDLERLFGLHDALIQITYTERAGRNLVEDAQLGTFQLVRSVRARPDRAAHPDVVRAEVLRSNGERERRSHDRGRRLRGLPLRLPEPHLLW